MNKPFYSKEQVAVLHARRTAAGGIAFDQAWTQLITEVRADMADGGGPTTDQAQALGRRWQALVNRFTGGDAEIERLLYATAEEFRIRREWAGKPVADVVGYMRRVLDALDGAR